MCLLSLLLSRVILSLVLFSPPWQVCPKHGAHPPPRVPWAPGMVPWQAVLHLLEPTLHVLSFIPQAHYLDRVVKGMVFLPLFSYCLCVCVCVWAKKKKCVYKRCIYTPEACCLDAATTAFDAQRVGFWSQGVDTPGASFFPPKVLSPFVTLHCAVVLPSPHTHTPLTLSAHPWQPLGHQN